MKIRKEAKIGLFAVAMILALYWGINYIKGTDLVSGTKTYYAVYDKVNGLQPSSQVVINGYKVGVLHKMYFDPAVSQKIVLELRIKSRFSIPDDSRAKVYSDGLMGGKAIEIELGSSPRHLSRGDTLFSQWDKDLLEMAGSEMEFIKQKASALVNSMNSTLDALNAILEDNSANIAATMGHVAGISSSLDEVISSQSAELKGTLHNLNRISGSLAAAAPRVENAIGNLEGFSSTLNSSGTAASMEKLSASLTSLSELLEKVNSGQGTAGMLLSDRGLYDSLTSASSNLSLLLEDMKANPKRYVHFSLFGGKKEK